MSMKIRLAGVENDSIVDGPGLRFSIFVQGCPHRCEGCHNPETHEFEGGYETDTDTLIAAIKKNLLLKGVTFSGGEPMCQPRPLMEIADAVHAMKKDVWLYSGYTFEEILSLDDTDCAELLKKCDVLVDGRFVQAEKSLELTFRGSKNQRIIDVKKSLESGSVVEIDMQVR